LGFHRGDAEIAEENAEKKKNNDELFGSVFSALLSANSVSPR